MDLKIPDNTDPSLQIDRFTAHFGRLSEQNVEIDDHIQAMILLTKLPPSMDFLAHFICQGTKVPDLNVGKIRKSMLLNWEQQSGGKTPHPQQAQKISAVKRGPNEPPFQQQQQQQQQQEGSGRGRRNR